MIKLKRILPFILAVCMVCSLCVSLGCSTKKELNSLSLDTSNAKIDFSLGEEYRSTGLVVTANYRSGKSEIIDTANVSIDSGAYDRYTTGSYDIIVSYSSEGTTAEASYKVNVVDALYGGLVVTLKSGRKQQYDLSESVKTVDFTYAATWIDVRKPDANGEVDMNSAALSRDSYSVKIYRNGAEVTELGAVKRGVYQIVASMYDAKEDYTFEGFTFITVFDDVNSITFKEGTTQQPKGLREVMTPTWKFTVTYNSGDTEVVDKTNPYLTLTKINPNIKEGSGTATATYGEPKVLTAPATSVKEVQVPYTLTGKQSNPDLAKLNFNDTSKFTVSSDALGTVVYEGGYLEFEVVGGDKGKIVNKSATIELPTGISIDGNTEYSCGQAFQSGGASTAGGMYINFTIDRNCEIYIYAKANGPEERCMLLETENDYAIVEGVEGYLGISGVPTEPTGDKTKDYSAHAASVKGLNKDIPAEFRLSFDSSINVFYVLIIFPEEAK